MPHRFRVRELWPLADRSRTDGQTKTDGRRVSRWRLITAPQLFVLSFLLLVLLGMLGLKVLPGLYTGEPLGWLDALFTATSAICVTGLIVVDTATYFTPLGQAWILGMIQIGGLGMITFTSVIIVALGRRLSLRQETLAASAVDVKPDLDFRQLTRDVIRFTFILEAIGAVVLFFFWIPDMGWKAAIWPAIFHSISAFCNAGFSTFSDSLIGFQHSPAILLTVGLIIVAGGIGFLTMEELYQVRKRRNELQPFRLSLHSRLVLLVTGVLILAGWILFASFEWEVTLKHLPWTDKLVNALFLSITPRTAGFNSIDYNLATDRSNFLTILLMSIGGSPGSTAGGIKTTTVAIIGLMAWSRLRGQTLASLWGRSIPEETIQRAIGLFVLAFGLVTAAIFVLTTSEIGNTPHPEISHGFIEYMFEAASAFNTVGLSMGVTPILTPIGKWVVILLMYVGRVGPLTFAAAVALKGAERSRRFRYAYEDVVVG